MDLLDNRKEFLFLYARIYTKNQDESSLYKVVMSSESFIFWTE